MLSKANIVYSLCINPLEDMRVINYAVINNSNNQVTVR